MSDNGELYKEVYEEDSRWLSIVKQLGCHADRNTSVTQVVNHIKKLYLYVHPDKKLNKNYNLMFTVG